MSQIRLDKYLADAGIGTRSQVKQYIRKKQVAVNGQLISSGDVKIMPETDIVTYQGEPVIYEAYTYYLLNKPAGYVSATTDTACQTVLDLIEESSSNLFPVGRLDKDTEGLLLITNDGALAHQLLSPRRHVDKTYYAELNQDIPTDAIAVFQAGMDIGDEAPTLPARLEPLTSRSAYLTIQEGRFHQVKRMFHAIGCEVTYLKRIRMGTLLLDETLKPGCYRRLTTQELQDLCNCGKNKNAEPEDETGENSADTLSH